MWYGYGRTGTKVGMLLGKEIEILEEMEDGPRDTAVLVGIVR